MLNCVGLVLVWFSRAARPNPDVDTPTRRELCNKNSDAQYWTVVTADSIERDCIRFPVCESSGGEMLLRSKLPRLRENRNRSNLRSSAPFPILDRQISDSILNHLKQRDALSTERKGRVNFPLTTGFDGIRFYCCWNLPIQINDGHGPDERVLRTRQQARLQRTKDEHVGIEDNPTPFTRPFRCLNRHTFVFQNHFVDRFVLSTLAKRSFIEIERRSSSETYAAHFAFVGVIVQLAKAFSIIGIE